MNYCRQFLLICAAVVCCVTLAVAGPGGKGAPDRTQTGSDIIVGPNDQAGELTCFG
jgi:hypothetical protein